MKEECGICGRVMRTTYMRQCQRCKKLFCRDCMTPDVATGDPNAMLCLHCASRIVAPISRSKYAGLTNHLKFRGAFTSMVKLSFARIDGLIGTNLPMAAYRDPLWWGNSGTNAQSKAWIEAGWEVEQVNFKEGNVWFKKVRDVPIQKSKRKKLEITKPFTPVPVHRARKPPSKTKVSKLYTRIKNLERQRQEGKPIRGLGGSRPQYEKRLYKSDKKPQ
ncbi:MAG: PHD finger domain-containing protein [Candidatus Bathyarchaeia archaeon]